MNNKSEKDKFKEKLDFLMKQPKRLLLIDTFYFLHRSFHAFPQDFQTSKGEPTGMVYGFTQVLLNSILDLSPTHIACGWESEELPSFRKELYAEYQATRIPAEPEAEKLFWDQVPRIEQIIEAFNIPRIWSNGFEGDDVLGTMAYKGAEQSAYVIISTADQDMLQLINDKVFVFRPAKPPFVRKTIFDKETFIEKYGFEPKQMIDYKALRGDPSDNIPGVKGIGDKTAKKLLKQFKSIEEIYENLDKIEKESVKKKLIEHKEDAFLSKQLATIITNIPLDFNLDACEVHDFNVEKVRKLFEELEFKSLMSKLEKLENRKIIYDKLNGNSKKNDQLSMF